MAEFDPVTLEINRDVLSRWCHRKAEFYRKMRDTQELPETFYPTEEDRAKHRNWCQGRMESFLETRDMLDSFWNFDKDKCL